MLNSSPSPSKNNIMDDAIDAALNNHNSTSKSNNHLEPTIDPQLQDDVVESLLTTLNQNQNTNTNNTPGPKHLRNLSNSNNKIPFLPIQNLNMNKYNNNNNNNNNNNINSTNNIDNFKFSMESPNFDSFITFTPTLLNKKNTNTINDSIFSFSPGFINGMNMNMNMNGMNMNMNMQNTPNNKTFNVEDLFDTPYINNLYSTINNPNLHNNINNSTIKSSFDTPISKLFEKNYNSSLRNINIVSSNLKNIRDFEEKSVSPCDNHKKNLINDDELMKNLDLKTMTSTPSCKSKKSINDTNTNTTNNNNHNDSIDSSPSTIIINSVTKVTGGVNLIECSPTPDNKDDNKVRINLNLLSNNHSSSTIISNNTINTVNNNNINNTHNSSINTSPPSIPVMGIFKENDPKDKIKKQKQKQQTQQQNTNDKDNIKKFRYQNSFNDKENKNKRKNHGNDKIHFIMADPDQLKGNKRRKKVLKNNTNIVNNRIKKNSESNNIFLENK